MDDQIQFRGTIERDFENILSKAGILPAELSHMILTFIPGTWHEEQSGNDTECRYCRHEFTSVSRLRTHLQTNTHQARSRKLAIPAYMKGKLPLSEDIGWVNPWLRSALIFTRIRYYQ